MRHRVQKLIESGVMQVVAVTDPMQMGFARQAMIGIKVSGNVRQVAAELSAMDKLDYIVITTGRFDILAELVAESDDGSSRSCRSRSARRQGRDDRDVRLPTPGKADVRVGVR